VHRSATAALATTPDDNWYVAFDSAALLPAMYIGRIPGSSAAMVAQVVEKLLSYEKLNAYKPKEALFAADNDDNIFEAVNEALIPYMPGDFQANRVYLRSYADPSEARQDLIDYIDEGMLITTYAGHGDVVRWAGENLFHSDYVPSLNNAKKLTFVMALDCLNGYFSFPQYYSLGEEFVIAPDKGAIAGFVPSGFGYTSEHAILSDEVFNAIFQQNNNLIGAVTTQARINAYGKGASADLVKSFVLIGDPAARLKINY
jgi:hypothetical protein